MQKKAARARRAIGVAIETLEIRRFLSAGSPDYSFAGLGKTTFGGGAGSRFSDVKSQTDGKLVAVGQLGLVTQNQVAVPVYAVFRYTFDGQLDSNFGGGDGVAELPSNWNPSASTFDLTIQTDGRIVVGGDIYSGGVAGVARFTSAGVPDTTLNNTGSLTTAGLNLGSPVYSAKVIALPSGPIYIVGFDPSAGDNVSPGVDVYRLNTAGTLDNNYGFNGSVHVATTYATLPRDVAISSSAKLLIAGNELTNDTDFVIRVTTGGLADSSFGEGDGLTEGALVGAKPNAILPIANDQFYIAGGYSQFNSEHSILARFTAAGGLDSSFGGSGVVAAVEGFAYQDAALTSDGKFLVTYNTGSSIAVEQLDSFGQPDGSFGTFGRSYLNLSDGFGNDTVQKIAVDKWNEPIIAGSTNSGADNVLARLTSDIMPTGTLTAKVFKDVDGDGFKDPEDTALAGRTLFIDVNSDQQFTAAKDAYGVSDAQGNVTINNAPAGFQFIQQIVPTGWKPSAPVNFTAQTTVVPGTTTDIGLFMTTPTVASPYLDSGFGVGGTALTGAADDKRYDNFIGVARMADGKLMSFGSAGGYRVFKYNSTGTPDTTWAPNGMVAPTLPVGFTPYFRMIADAQGRLLIAGRYQGNTQAMIRILATGQVDATFGTNGVAALTGYAGEIHDIAVDSLGRIVVAGHNSNTDIAVARLTSGGQFDNTFDGDGKAIFDIKGYDSAWGVAIQSDDKIVVSGEGFDAVQNQLDYGYLLRLKTDGTRDSGFGVNGVAFFYDSDLPNTIGVRFAKVAIMPDGRLVAAGTMVTNSGNYINNMVAARFTSDGKLDSTFGAGKGYAIANFPRATGGTWGSPAVESVNLLADGSIYVSGEADVTAEQSYDIVAARFRVDGSLETGFGSGGKVSAALSNGSDHIYGATVDPTSGKLIVGGYAGGDSRGLLAQFAAPAGRIGGFIYDDTDGDGVRDTGENALVPGRVAYLDTNNNAQLDAGEQSFTTVVDGFYFYGLSPGSYTVRILVPAGYQQTQPTGNGAYTVNVTAGGNNTLYFGLAPVPAAVSITGVVFTDNNGNGTKDAGDAALSGRNVYLDANNNSAYDAGEALALSNSSGVYIFANLPDGNYIVRMSGVGTGSYAQTYPYQDAGYNVTLTGGSQATGKDFGVRSQTSGTVTGSLFEDLDADGVWDAGESPIVATVFADLNRDGIMQAGEPSSPGTGAQFTLNIGAQSAPYNIRVIAPDGYRPTFPGSGYYTIALTGLDRSPRLRNFGVARDGLWASGTVFNDADGNGLRNGNETAIANVRVWDDVNNNGVYDAGEKFDLSRVSTGIWGIVGLGAGAHNIRVERGAYQQTLPANNAARIVTGDGSYQFTNNLDFGLKTIAVDPQQPFSGTPIAIGASAVTIQLEDFDKGGEGIAYHDLDSANLGGQYRKTEGVDIQTSTDSGAGFGLGYVKAGEWLEYTINVTTAGNYDFDFRLAATSANGKFHAEVDGVNVTGALTVPNTGGYQTWKNVGKTGIALTAGQHVIRVAMDTNGANGSVGNFNWLKLTPSSVTPPPPPPPPPGDQTPYTGTPIAIGASSVTIQAEDFDKGGEGVAYHDIEKSNQGGKYRTGEGVDIGVTTDTGGGFNIGFVKPGEWLEYTINVASAGNYTFDFRLAAASSNGKFHVEVDGSDATGALTVPNTNGWQTWKTLTKTGVALSAGQHVLRIAMDTNGSGGSVTNFNSFTIKPDGQQPPPPPPPPPGQSITIQAEDFDAGSEGVAYHDLDSANQGGKYRTTGVDIQATTDTGGGYNIGYVKAGEWLNYTTTVTTAGSYNFDFRLAAGATGAKFHLEVDGVDVTGAIAVPNTGGWQNWTTITKTGVTLSAGTHVLKLKMDTNGTTGSVANFNWLRLTAT